MVVKVIDENEYALGEMTQWIWRSVIRENGNIEIYIPSNRMRELLINCLNLIFLLTFPTNHAKITTQ